MSAGQDALRPVTLTDFTGQPDVVSQLSLIITAARSRGELCDHLLFTGPPGLGKTTLAGIVAHELSTRLVTTSGPAIEKPGELAALLSGVTEPSVVFIDEIHRLARPVEEILYPAMEDGVLDLMVGEGPRSRSIRLPLAPMCIVGATTQAGMISAPLRDRFRFVARMRLYDVDELSRIVSRSSRLLNFPLGDEAAAVVASRSRGTPRIANSLLRRVRDWCQVHQIVDVDADAAGRALDAFGIDPWGLDSLSLELMHTLCTTFRGGPVGLNTLAAAVGESPQTVADVYEPYLMARGLIVRTPRGREATAATWSHLGLTADTDVVTSPPQSLFDDRSPA